MNIYEVITKQSQIYDSFYLYDESCILDNTQKLLDSFPGVEFLYSVKCNPNTNVLNCVFGQGFGADAASLGEVLLSCKAGLPKEKIYYSAPGKTLKDIRESIEKSFLIADSIDEIHRIQKVAEEMDIKVKIGLRINPDFTYLTDSGVSSKFGIDEDQAAEFITNSSCDRVRINGIHVHLKSQELDANILAGYHKKMFVLAEKFDKLCGGLEYLNLGSGIGIPYEEGDAPFDLSYLSSSMEKELAGFKTICSDTKVMIEVGRFAVCKSGVYVTKVLDRKVSHGKTYIILKNTMNGFIRPSLAKMVLSYTNELSPKGTEPLFTSRNAFSFITLKEGDEEETVTLVGNLCTSADVIAEDITLPRLEAGDLVVINNAGGYAAVLSPIQFSSQEKPAELFLTAKGDITV
ncbi:MAG: diaminopimelate decarboxylase [Firmicutes bacterium]|nr:diaminopimelate decarboxylase [Bacillota bacterium]